MAGFFHLIPAQAKQTCDIRQGNLMSIISPRFTHACDLRASGQIENALREFHSIASEINDADGKAAVMLNEHRCHCDLGHLKHAEETMRKIRALKPIDPIVNMNINFGDACMQILAGREGKGILIFDKILKGNSEILQTPDYLNLYEDIQQRKAFALCNMRRYREALPILNEAMQFRTETADIQSVHFYLGICFVEMGNNESAKHEFLHVINMGLDLEANSRYRLAMIEFHNGALASALCQLEQILRTKQDAQSSVPHMYVYEFLAKVSDALGNESEASRYRQEAQQCNSGRKL